MGVKRIGIAAWLALLAPAAPWMMIASLSAHLAEHAPDHPADHAADHGHSDNHVHARALAFALHGHPHPPGTPDHEHAMASVNPAPPRGKTAIGPVIASQGRVDAGAQSRQTARLPAAIGPEHDPPAVLVPSPALRI
jgi:hypothetical protein